MLVTCVFALHLSLNLELVPHRSPIWLLWSQNLRYEIYWCWVKHAKLLFLSTLSCNSVMVMWCAVGLTFCLHVRVSYLTNVYWGHAFRVSWDSLYFIRLFVKFFFTNNLSHDSVVSLQAATFHRRQVYCVFMLKFFIRLLLM